MIPIISDGVAVYAYKAVDGNLQFLQMRRTKDDTLGQSWQPVYGGIKQGEKAVDAAKRELLEEAGVIPNCMFLVEHIETFFFRPNNAIHMLPVFAAELEPDATIQLNEEHDQLRWVIEDEVNSKFMWRSQREAIAVLIDTLRNFPDLIPHLIVFAPER